MQTLFLLQDNLSFMMIRDHEALTRGAGPRKHALAIAMAGVDAVLPENVIKNTISIDGNMMKVAGQVYDLSRYRRILIAGGGKASGTMAMELEKILGSRIAAGVVIDRYGAGASTKIIKVIYAGHPLPTEDGVRGMREIHNLLATASKDDLVILLISGGGSSLMPCPAPGLALEDIARLTDLLLKSGATIAEINCVRKHISRSKGGQILRWTDDAEVLSLIVSDVVGDDPSFIASGPTAPDDTTFADALAILDKYRLTDRIPPRILSYLRSGVAGNMPETLKQGDPAFNRVKNIVIASGIVALKAAAAKAADLGYQPIILGSYIKGESRVVGLVHAGIARECLASGNPVSPPAAIISGGETTVTVRGGGKGGRNQEFVLGFLRDCRAGMTALAIDTDGIDGATDASGAIADGSTLERATQLSLSVDKALEDNASFDFFKKLGDLIYTGPTGTNVSDLRVVLVHQQR